MQGASNHIHADDDGADHDAYDVGTDDDDDVGANADTDDDTDDDNI